ncbi:MAG: mcpA 4 [Firmicutes bacterium]|nr:mcpA 4 [Bacillota bacterium]
MEKYLEIIHNITCENRNTSEQAASASTQIVKPECNCQSSLVSEANQVIEAMSANIQQISSSANAVMQTTNESNAVVKGCEDAIDIAVTQMLNIEDSVVSSAEFVANLSEHSQQIVNYIEYISKLASQTNFVVDKMAIETDRSGITGRSLESIAEEIKYLSEQSQVTAKKIAVENAAMQMNIKKTIVALQEGILETKFGSGIVCSVKRAFERVTEQTVQVSQQMEDISMDIIGVAASNVDVVCVVNEIDKTIMNTKSSTTGK